MHNLNRREVISFVEDRCDLFDAASAANPFASSQWVLHFLECIAQDDWTFLAPEYPVDGQSTMLLYQRPEAPRRYLSLTNYDAPLYSPLISSAQDRGTALQGLVRQIIATQPRCIAINFAPLDAEAYDTSQLARTFEANGWYAKRYFCFGNWHLPCAGLSFEQYMSSRDPQLYNTWRYRLNRFANTDGATLEILTRPEDVARGMAAYERINQRSWKKAEPHPDFIRGWAEICAREGWLRLGLACVGDTPIAAQFWFTTGQRAYIFKLACDESYARFSPDTLLSAYMIHHSLEIDRVHEIDYMTGDDGYKRSWMPLRRERIGLMMCNPRTARGLLLATHQLASEARQRWLDAIRPANPDAIGTRTYRLSHQSSRDERVQRTS